MRKAASRVGTRQMTARDRKVRFMAHLGRTARRSPPGVTYAAAGGIDYGVLASPTVWSPVVILMIELLRTRTRVLLVSSVFNVTSSSASLIATTTPRMPPEVTTLSFFFKAVSAF